MYNHPIGAIVTIRPSQQIYWKSMFGNLKGYVNSTNAWPINYVLIANDCFYTIREVNCNDYIYDRNAASSWFEWELEGDPMHNYAAKHIATYKTYLDKYPCCFWCHEPIEQTLYGEWKGHWRHQEQQTSNVWGGAIGNRWNCVNHKTIDGKWHIATHPIYGTCGTGEKVSNNVIQIPKSKPYIVPDNYNGSFIDKFGRNDTILAVHQESNDLGITLVEIPKTRRFKNLP